MRCLKYDLSLSLITSVSDLCKVEHKLTRQTEDRMCTLTDRQTDRQNDSWTWLCLNAKNSTLL